MGRLLLWRLGAALRAPLGLHGAHGDEWSSLGPPAGPSEPLAPSGLPSQTTRQHNPGRSPRPHTVSRTDPERLDDHLLNLLVGDLARLTRPRLVGQPIKSVHREAVAPLAHGADRDPQLARDLGVVRSRGGREHDPRPQSQSLSTRSPSLPRLQLPRSSTVNSIGTATGEGMTPTLPHTTRINASGH